MNPEDSPSPAPDISPDRFLDKLLHRIDELPPDSGEASGEDPLESVAFEEFEVLGELGRGGMGIVYMARQKSLNRLVALKFLPAHLGFSPNSRERIRREAQAIARLHHPHLVRIHSVGEKDGAPFLAMEFVPGVPLSSLLEGVWKHEPQKLQGPDLHRAFQDAWHARFAKLEGVVRNFSPGQETESPFWFQSYDRILAHWVRQIADALHAAHKCEVLHRDVKPSNILITAAGDAVLADFGLAWETGAESLTQSEEFVGTLHYAAPEAILGKEGQRNPASDIYSLGMVLYESLTLSNPFEGESRAQAVHRIATVEPERVRKRNPAVDPSVETICMRAIEKEPSWRYGSARDMAADLDRFFGGQAVEPSTIGDLSRVMRRLRRHPWTPWVLSATAILAGGIGVWRGLGRGAEFDPAKWAALPLLQEPEREFADGCASVVASSLTPNFKIYSRAQKKLGAFLEKFPDDPSALALLALVEVHHPKDSPEFSAERLLSLYPDSLQVRELVLKLRPGQRLPEGPALAKRALSGMDERVFDLCLALESRNFARSREILENLVESEHDLAWPRLSYGFVCILTVDQIQFVKGEMELRRYLEKAPDDPLANTGLGFIILNGIHSKEAGPYFERALAADPSLWPAQDLWKRWESLQKQ